MTSTQPKTLTERADELTGRDELAIVDHFDHDFWDTFDEAVDPDAPTSRKINSRLGRMLVFAEKLHDGVPPKVAFANVMAMTVTEVTDSLGYGGTDDTPDDDSGVGSTEASESPAGKDESTDD